MRKGKQPMFEELRHVLLPPNSNCWRFLRRIQGNSCAAAARARCSGAIPPPSKESLRVLVRGLRARIERSKIPQYIVTERNFGYRFDSSSERFKSSRWG